MIKKVILGVLALLIILIILVYSPLLFYEDEHTKAQTAAMRISKICNAIEDYYKDNQRTPTMEQGLEALVRPSTIEPIPTKFKNGGYINRILKDPWGNAFHYYTFSMSGKSYFEVWTYGSDSIPGGSDDAKDIRSSEIPTLDDDDLNKQ